MCSVPESTTQVVPSMGAEPRGIECGCRLRVGGGVPVVDRHVLSTLHHDVGVGFCRRAKAEPLVQRARAEVETLHGDDHPAPGGGGLALQRSDDVRADAAAPFSGDDGNIDDVQVAAARLHDDPADGDPVGQDQPVVGGGKLFAIAAPLRLELRAEHTIA